MLTISEFTNDEIKAIESSLKGSKVYFIIYAMLFVPLSLLLGLTGLSKKGFGYWPTTLVLLVFFSLLTFYLFVKENILCRKDLRDRQKYTGTIKVLKKSRKRNDCIIYIDAKEIKKIDVLTFEIFDQIEVGDSLHIEIAVSSKYIFKLDKGILPLVKMA
jgi:hypothetical protein